MEMKVRRLAVMVSGSGTILQSIIDVIKSKVLDADIVTVVSEKEEAFALARAQKSGIHTHVLRATTAEERDKELNGGAGRSGSCCVS